MRQPAATTVAEYLAGLPEDRRGVVKAVRAVLKKNLPRGYQETLRYGLICYEVPLKRFADTYNKQPLMYAALAAQKNHFAVYLNCIDAGSEREAQLRAEFAKEGKKLSMGKACVRFKRLDDLALGAIGRAIAAVGVDEFIARYQASRKKA
jgi:hypothetical protein